MLLVVEPNDLRAWRMRLGLSQAQVAKRAKTDRERVNIVENHLVGKVTTYIAINRALREIQSEIAPDSEQPQEQVA